MSDLGKLMEREINSDDVRQLRTLMRLPDDFGEGGEGDLPYELRQAYWSWKLLHDRIDGSGLTTIDFKCIGMFAGVGRLLEGDEKTETFLDAVKAGQVENGDPVVFLFRRKHVPGFYQGMTHDKKFVRIADETGNERQIVPTDVFLDPQREPANLTPASAKKAEAAADPKPKGKPGRPKKAQEPVAAAATRGDIHAGQDLDDDI